MRASLRLRAAKAFQLLCDPRAYALGLEAHVHRELDARLRFYLLNDINKPQSAEPDNPDNLTDIERGRWFGGQQVTMDDVTWEALEALLCPKHMENSVFRVTEALDGSRNNERFSCAVRGTKHANRLAKTEIVYTPRTVTLYDSKEQAIAAAKVLRMLTKGSGATIFAEPIETGMQDPQWVVSDNMDLQTHNALRFIFVHLLHARSGEERQALQKVTQREVNARLPAGASWEAYEGVPTLLTLQGRPGVKMYKKDENGKDDKADVAAIALIPKQELPQLMLGVPHETVIAHDGRRFADPRDMKAIVGNLLLGPHAYALVSTGAPKAMGEILKREAAFIEEPAQAPSVFNMGDSTGKVASDIIGWPQLMAFRAAGAAVVVVGTGSLMGVLAPGYFVLKRLSKKDPLAKLMGRLLEAETAYFSKQWVPRETHAGLATNAGDIMRIITHNRLDETLYTPMGDVPVQCDAGLGRGDGLPRFSIKQGEAGASRASMQSDEPGASRFLRFMSSANHWPDEKTYTENNAHPVPEGLLENEDFLKARAELARSFYNWCMMAGDYQYKREYAHSFSAHVRTDFCFPDVASESKEMGEAIDRFRDTLRGIERLRGDSSVVLIKKTREALVAGVAEYIKIHGFSPPSSAQVG